MHNVITNQSQKMQVQFPRTQDQNAGGKPPVQFSMNGYYDKEAVSLKNGFKPEQNQFLQPVDARLYNPNENFNQDNSNKLYKPNQELLLEIEQAQKKREYQRNKRRQEDQQDLGQQVEEISPSGVKR